MSRSAATWRRNVSDGAWAPCPSRGRQEDSRPACIRSTSRAEPPSLRRELDWAESRDDAIISDAGRGPPRAASDLTGRSGSLRWARISALSVPRHGRSIAASHSQPMRSTVQRIAASDSNAKRREDNSGQYRHWWPQDQRHHRQAETDQQPLRPIDSRRPRREQHEGEQGDGEPGAAHGHGDRVLQSFGPACQGERNRIAKRQAALDHIGAADDDDHDRERSDQRGQQPRERIDDPLRNRKRAVSGGDQPGGDEKQGREKQKVGKSADQSGGHEHPRRRPSLRRPRSGRDVRSSRPGPAAPRHILALRIQSGPASANRRTRPPRRYRQGGCGGRRTRGDEDGQSGAGDGQRPQRESRGMRSDQLDPPAVKRMIVVVVDLRKHAEKRLDGTDEHDRPGFVEPQGAAPHRQPQGQANCREEPDQPPPGDNVLALPLCCRRHRRDIGQAGPGAQWPPLAGASAASPYVRRRSILRGDTWA